MKPLFRDSLAVAAVACAFAGGALAQSAVEGAIKARKAHMQLYAFNLGPLGAMAKGEMPYDSAQASALAGNLAALAGLNISRYWPEGSAQGQAEGTRALPAIWENSSDVMAKAAALNEALTALNAAAGTDLASLQGAMGAVGEACGGCHKAYRATE
jgi:cytochrome c556